MMKKTIPFVLVLCFYIFCILGFSACSVDFTEKKDATPARFFPEEKTVQASAFQPSAPENAVFNPDKTLFFVLENCTKEDMKNCSISVKKADTQEEIFSFSGNVEEKMGGFPIMWSENMIITQTIQQKQLVQKEFFSAFSPITQEKSNRGEVKIWKPLSETGNTLVAIKIEGKNYFFDVVSDTKAITIYQIGDITKEFSVKGGNMENLSFIVAESMEKNFLLRNIIPTGKEILFSSISGETIKTFAFSLQTQKISSVE